MKMNEEVLTALEVLKAHAENDFERHRIDVLIKDLTDPPKVEIIDETHQKFNGVIFARRKYGTHYVNSHYAIHRAVWQYYNGEIPVDDVYEVHHRDLNAANNLPNNLQLLTKVEHNKLHGIYSQKPPHEKICPICGKVFFTKNSRQTYCSHDCVLKIPRVPKRKPLVERICPICGKNFIVSPKNPNQTACSRKCGDKLAAITRGKPPLEKTCPVCGKIFYTKRKDHRVCCSKVCSHKLAGLKNKKRIDAIDEKSPKRVCPCCGKEFVSNVKTKIYCSEKCCSKMRWEKLKSKHIV